MNPVVELTEKLLADAGGWQAMKHARALCEMGRVVSANYIPPLLKGVVRDGEKEYRAGLKISSRSDIENSCTCRDSREWGTICAHSLAIGLAILRPKAALATAAKPATADKPRTGPFFSAVSEGNEVRLHVVLAPNFEAAWEKNAIMIGAEIEHGGGRVLIHALDRAKTYRCVPEDAAVIETMRSLNEGELAGMMMLSREKCVTLLEALRKHSRVTFGRTRRVNVSELLEKLGVKHTAGATSAVPQPESQDSEKTLPATPDYSLTIEGSLNHLTARLQCIYGQRVVTLGVTSRSDQFPGRNPSAENAALDRLTRSGFSGPDAVGNYVLKGERNILRFFAQELPHVQKAWDVTLGSRFTNITSEIERIQPRIDVQSSGEAWFDLSVSLSSSSGQQFSSAEIQRLLQMGQNHLRLRNSKIAVFDAGMLDELQNVLVDCDPQQPRAGIYRVNRVHAGYIDAVVGTVHGSPEWRRWTTAQREADRMEPIPLGSLEEVLRPYQKQGVYWMNFLAKNGFGGILADEMGLGKTLQALAFLRTIGGPALIVCPSSLVYNWEREAERFTPDRRRLVISGADRTGAFAQIRDADLVITSYALLRNDIERYHAHEFGVVILDEAQHIKNPDTQNAQAAAALRARHRFVLTGTPMENSIRDLWSIMHFLLPGYLGTRTDFKERYEIPICRDGATAVQERLGKRLRPFLMRRLKKTVATDLPDKIEQVVYCELTQQQAEVYKSLLTESRRKIEDAADTESETASRMLILTALLRLRQACCDLRLLQLPDIDAGSASGKIALIDELLQEVIDGGHRVLIFSQFASMLQILKAHFDLAKIEYCHLDGRTKERAREVDRFQQDGGPPIFLISLKAGGTGLNLTAADTVIHFDPWWNPAVEAQATDRAHRIGQRKIVTAYKLVARGTVEEKILNLQRKKRELIAATVESDEPLMSGLSLSEIESLLE